jgi:hypothetical protein
LTGTFNVKSLGELVARALGLQPGDDVEVARDRLNPNRLLVVRHAEAEGQAGIQT